MNKTAVEEGLSGWIKDIAPKQSLFVGISRFAPTGELYNTVNTQLWKSSSEAYVEYQQLFIEALPSDKDGYPHNFSVYWRKFPVLIEDENGFSIKSRFICSDAPINESLVKGHI